MDRTFKRDLTELAGVFSFLDEFADEQDVGMPTVLPVRLAIEELFTNMVRHNEGGISDISISIDRRDDKVIVVMTDTATAGRLPYDTRFSGVPPTRRLYRY